MTPLPRWVFLALLLGTALGFSAHRRNACVRLCRAQKSNPAETRGACNYKTHVLQSERSGSAIERLFRLCLDPCSEPDSPLDPLIFEDSSYCRSLRDSLVRLRACTCDPLDDALSSEYWADSTWIGPLLEDYVKHEIAAMDTHLPLVELLRKSLRKGGPLAAADLEDSRHRLLESKETMNLLRARVDLAEDYNEEEQEDVDVIVDTDVQAISTVAPGPSDERPVDWEMWCMAQCDNGLGGTACNCDIIP